MERKNVIVVSTDIQKLTGIGTEYLISENGEIIACFINGELECRYGLKSGETREAGFISIDSVLFTAVGAALIYLYGC
jgi:hypothetical protein